MLLRTLGGLTLEDSPFTRPKPLLLLAYLALEGPKERRFLAELFWMGKKDPLNCLSTTLQRLRRGTSEVIGADEVRVWAGVKTDAQQLLSAVGQGAFEEAIELYRGPFLEGVYLRDAGEELEEWVYHTREFLANQLRRSRLALANAHAATGRFKDAAKQAEAAYRLAGAPSPDPKDLLHLYTLMLAGHSPYASEVREEAAGFDLDLAHTSEEAKERLQRVLKLDSNTDKTPLASFTSRRMEQQIRFCSTKDGVRIAYATVGEGPVLVKAANWLSHLDFDWNSPVWRHWLQALSRHRTLVRYDERGCGLSDWNVEEFSVDAWVHDLETVVDTIGCKRFPLLGVSQGGAVAIAYAVRHPERVSHLILYGAYARGRLKRGLSGPQLERQLEEEDILLKLIRLGWARENPAFRQVFTTNFIPEGTPEQFRWFNDLQRISTSPENAENFMRSFGTIDVTGLAPKLKVPTLVLHAKDDAGIPFEEGRLLATLIPNARFVPLEGMNHILLESGPAWQRFLDEVYRFIGIEDAGMVHPSTTEDRFPEQKDKRFN